MTVSLRHALPLLGIVFVWLLLLSYSGVNRNSGLAPVLGTKRPWPLQQENGDEVRMRKLLAEAEKVWQASKKKQVQALRRLGSYFLKEPWRVHELTIIWDLFAPAFHCPHPVERLGRVGDGGKWVCGFTHLANGPARRRPCVVYSYGVGIEVTFEREVLERSSCVVRLFDDTISTTEGAAADLAREFPDRVLLKGTGLGVGNVKSNTSERHSLRADMDLLGESFVDILKVDVEGAEFETMLSTLADFTNGLPWGQLLVEVHMSILPLEAMVPLFAAWLERLESAGLRAFYSEFNQIPSNEGNRSYIDYAEYSFLNVKLPPEYFLR